MLNAESLLSARQVLALAVGLQVFFLIALFWRGILGKPAKTGMRPRWLYLPLIAGTALGVWYGAMQDDLVFVLAQALALFLGVCALRSPRLAPPDAPSNGASGGVSGKASGRKGDRPGGGKGRT